MNSKLTLKLQSDIIAQAKEYAKKNHTSISKMVENYLKSVTEREVDADVSPLVKSLTGVIDDKQIDQSNYSDFLDEKYQ